MLLKRKHGRLERLLTIFGLSKLTSIFDMLFWMHSDPLEASFGRFLGVQEALLGTIWAPMRLPRGSPEPPWGGIFLSKSSLILHTPFWSSFWTLLGHFGVPFWLPKAPPNAPKWPCFCVNMFLDININISIDIGIIIDISISFCLILQLILVLILY